MTRREGVGVSADSPEDLAAPQELDLLDAPPEDAAEDAPAERLARRRRLRWYLLGGVAALVVVLVAALGPGWWRLVSQRRASLATPDRVAGLALDRSADGAATADDLRAAIAASVSLNNSVGAVYDDPTDSEHPVMFFGGTGVLLSPDKDLTAAFSLLDDESGGLAHVRSVPAGPLGGEMKCGTSSGDGNDMAVCGWADHGSIALALFPGRTVDDAAALIREIRASVQHRS